MKQWGRPIVMRVALGAIVVALSGCAVYGRHGRVRVGVSLPIFIPIPIPVPGPRDAPQPEYPQQPPPQPIPTPAPPPPSPSPPPVERPVYPSAGSPQDGAYVGYGTVRSIETSPHRGMVRVVVMLDNRSVRTFDLPGTNLRIGERVRVEGDRIYRS